MKGGWRFAQVTLAAGLALGSATAHAQSTDLQSGSPPPADTVGPRELQNFSLSGPVDRQADQPAADAPAPAPKPPLNASPAPQKSRSAETAAQQSPKVMESPPRIVKRSAEAAVDKLQSTSIAQAPRIAVSQPLTPPVSPAPVNSAASPLVASPPLSSPSDHRLLTWPWLLAALVLAGGMALLFWRNRQRHAFAGADLDLFAAPELAPAPPAPGSAKRPSAKEPSSAPVPPVPAPSPKKVPDSGRIVSSRLRPWLEIAIRPLRCIVEDDQMTVEFELELFNSGTAPARGVLVEAAIFNAGPAQDEEIGRFMAQPVGAGEGVDAIPPLQRLSFTTKVATPRTALQVFEVAGRQLFVPLIAFNALYGWTGGEAQSSVSYLLGRDTKGEKLAPFRADLGPRVFRGLAIRSLPLAVRR